MRKKNIKDKEEDVLSVLGPDTEQVPGNEVTHDTEASYTMDQIVVDDGSPDDAETLAVKPGNNKKNLPTEEEDDEWAGLENDLEVGDPYLDDSSYDPDNLSSEDY